MDVRPLHDRIVVQRLEDAPVAGAIIIPDSAKEKPQRGRVIAAGIGRFKDDGTRVPLDVKTGHTILFGKFAGQEIKLDGMEHVIMREDDVLGVTVAKEIDLADPLENMGAQVGTISGVIDSAKVVRSALQNTATIASLLLITEAVISQLAD